MRYTDETLTRGPVGEEEGHKEREPWGALKPSTGPALSRAEHDALSPGMVIACRWPTEDGHTHRWRAYLVGEHGLRHHLWRMSAWGPAIETAWDRCDRALVGAPEVRLPKLPRLSFVLTADAVRERRKTVTRRIALPTWWKEGAWFLGVDRIRQAGAQGLCVAQCGLASHEPLVSISQQDVYREGFDTTPEGFCAMFRSMTPREWNGWVWRLPFTYMEIPK